MFSTQWRSKIKMNIHRTDLKIIKKGNSTVWSGAKYSLSLILFLWCLLPFLSLHYIFSPFSMTLLWHIRNSSCCERGSRVTFPFLWMFTSWNNLETNWRDQPKAEQEQICHFLHAEIQSSDVTVMHAALTEALQLNVFMNTCTHWPKRFPWSG